MIFSESILRKKGLRYSKPEDLIIERRRRGRGFCYIKEDTTLVKTKKQKTWFESLAVPPVYKNVFYCYDQKGHLQALGKDTTGTVQYFYHPKWEKLREEYKFARLWKIGNELPSMRRKLYSIFKNKKTDKTYVLAAITKVLDNTGLRIGSPSSAKKNQTYGISTLKKRHLKCEDDDISLEFSGKGGVEITREIENSAVKTILEDFYERPGELLFQYKEEDTLNSVSPAQINNFISELSTIEMTAKEFRTWRASALFVKFWLRKDGTTKTLGNLLEDVSQFIGNTPSILRNSYIHPVLIKKKKDKEFSISKVVPFEKRGLRKAEAVLMAFLEKKYRS